MRGDSRMSDRSAVVNGVCARCGNIADLDVMDFGAFEGDMTCADCWDAECERAWAEADREAFAEDDHVEPA